jgi:hypothetical protein
VVDVVGGCIGSVLEMRADFGGSFFFRDADQSLGHRRHRIEERTVDTPIKGVKAAVLRPLECGLIEGVRGARGKLVYSTRFTDAKRAAIGGSVCFWPAQNQGVGSFLATTGECGSRDELSELGHLLGQVR